MFEQNMFDSGQNFFFDIRHKTGEKEMELIGDEETESKSGTDIMSGEDNKRAKKKHYHRHTQHQIQELEAFFKECPHPDDKQRKDMGKRLGLEPLQVKFWFQNKRTQMKGQHERHENTQLRNENDKLRAENLRYKEALSSASCPTCGGPVAIGDMSFDDHQLRIENARLREEIDRISGIAAKYIGKPMLTYPNNVSFVPPQPEMCSAGEFLRSVSGPTNAEKPVIIELAVAAMEEFFKLAQSGEPLWIQTSLQSTQTLNQEEYFRTFPRPKPLGFNSESSREHAVVIMNYINLLEILMDVNQWTSFFAGLVSKATTLQVLSTGVAGNYNGALQVMTAEFQVPSPLVPTRENYFARYCKQHSDGSWAVVDVSLDNNSVSHCRRRPSGCLIQELPNGYSKVKWIEHVEVDDRAVHSIYRPLVNSGLAFGAKRWVATLDRQCERIACVMANNIPTGDVITCSEGRKSILRLAERMVVSFCSGVGASTAHTWTTLSGSGADDVRVMTRKSIDDPGRPSGIVLSAATSFRLPVPTKTVFDFLRDDNSRSEWDILSNGGIVQEMAHIANGRDSGNSVSLLRVNSGNSSQNNMLILQESCTDSTGSYVIYAPVDIAAMNVVLGGGDPDYVALLPSGFAILPDGSSTTTTGVANPESNTITAGSLLTVAFQILVDSVPTAKLSLGSVATVNSLINCTVERIKTAILCQNA